jgi:hypothetical protein
VRAEKRNSCSVAALFCNNQMSDGKDTASVSCFTESLAAHAADDRRRVD